jgi:TM2 domain-containing membrane protein YozV
MHVPQQYPALNPSGYLRPEKSLGVAYLLWFFLGFLGVHHFYLGKVGRGVGYLLTFGWFMIGLFVDLFTLPAQVKRINYERKVGLR